MSIWDWVLRPFRRAQELPQPRPGSTFVIVPGTEPDAFPITKKEDQLAAYAGWVYAATSLIAQDVRAAEFTLWQKSGRDRKQWKQVDDHPLLRLFARPTITHTWGDLLELTQLNLDLAGDAFWHLVTDQSDKVIGIQPVMSHWVQEPVIEDGRLAGWWVQVPGWGTRRMIPIRDMIWFRYPHPLEPWRGASPVEAFAATYHFDLYLRAYGATLMRNDAGIPAGVITTEEELTEEEADILRERWRDRYYRRRDGVAVLGKGAEYRPIAIPLSDLRFLEVGRFTRDQILAIYRVPASKLGLVEDVNRANADANDRTYKANSLRPRLRRLEEAINVYVLPRILGAEARRYYFEFADPVETDPQLELQRLSIGLKGGAVTINEYREAAGLDPLPGGDKVLLPVALTPTELRQQAEGVQTRDITEKDLELAAWRFYAKQDALERSAKSQIRAIFSREQKLMLKALKEQSGQRGLEARAFYDEVLDKTSDDWRQTLNAIWLKGLEDGWHLAVADFGGEGLPWSVYEVMAAEYASRHAALQVSMIQDTTRREVAKIIQTAIEEGWAVDQIALELARKFDDFKGPRATTIARTETAQAVNRGKWDHAREAARRYGWQVRRRWSAILDERVRETHAAAHGQEVGLNEPYLVGGAHLAHPGDPAGPAREVINCRCTETYEVVRPK